MTRPPSPRGASRLRSSLAIWAAWLAFGTVGCSLDAPNDSGTVPRNRCRRSTDCPTESRCILDVGLCTGPLERAYRVGLVVAPGNDRLGQLPEQHVGPLTIDQLEMRRDVSLQRPLAVVGDVTSMDLATGALRHVPAELRFVASPPWPGAPPVVHAASTASRPMETSAGPADYWVRLRAGVRYDLLVRPTGEAAAFFPPLRFEGVQVPAEGDLWRLDISYGDTADRGLRVAWPPRRLRLRLAYEDAPTGGYEPLEGIQVRLIDADTGRTVSTVARSDARGEVDLALSPGAGEEVLLRVSAGEDRPFFPTLTVPPTLLHPADVPLLLLPRPRPVRYVGRVEVAGSGEPLEEATISFESDTVFDPETGLQGSFRATVSTSSGSEGEAEEEGRFEVVLLPGRYEVRIVPVDPSLAVAVHEMEVLPLEGSAPPMDPSAPPVCGRTARCGRLFEVSPRAHVTGRIRHWQGGPFPGVLVEGRARGIPLPSDPAARAAPYNRPASSVSDGTGRFALPLDVGRYDMRIVPPSEHRWAPVLWRDVTVRNEDLELPEQTITPPVLLSGAVLGSDGSPWPDATVRAYLLMEDGDGSRPIFVAQGRSDASGRYELLLPTAPPALPTPTGRSSREPVVAPAP